MREKKKNYTKNRKLMNAKVEQKFNMSFLSVYASLAMVTLFAVLNIVIYAHQAGIGIFDYYPRTVGFLLLIGSVLGSVLLIRKSAKNLTVALVEPIYELCDVVNQMKDGDFCVDIQYKSEDEIGVLAEELRETCNQMHTIVEDANYMMEEMANGHLNVTSKRKEQYLGEFHILSTSMDKLKRELSDTMHNIQISSEQLMVSSEQLAGSAQDLAGGASDQAGAVEELTATIENVTNIAEDSANVAVAAANSVASSVEEARKSREEMNHLTEAMDRITITSREIENIITAIEEIASQTNLLSLNASIEAARAGEAGRGFAVVADQIGKLAADSAKSAVSTRELISKSLLEIESGSKIVENTIESFGTVLANMDDFVNMASGAAESSKTQADLLGQVVMGIGQISSVVQNNSAAAQEASAMSEEVSAQATKLDTLVDQFTL